MADGIIAGVCVEGSGPLWKQEGEEPRIALYCSFITHSCGYSHPRGAAVPYEPPPFLSLGSALKGSATFSCRGHSDYELLTRESLEWPVKPQQGIQWNLCFGNVGLISHYEYNVHQLVSSWIEKKTTAKRMHPYRLVWSAELRIVLASGLPTESFVFKQQRQVNLHTLKGTAGIMLLYNLEKKNTTCFPLVPINHLKIHKHAGIKTLAFVVVNAPDPILTWSQAHRNFSWSCPCFLELLLLQKPRAERKDRLGSLGADLRSLFFLHGVVRNWSHNFYGLGPPLQKCVRLLKIPAFSRYVLSFEFPSLSSPWSSLRTQWFL